MIEQLPFTLDVDNGPLVIRAADRQGGLHVLVSAGDKSLYLTADQARQVSDALAFAASELDKRKPS